MNSNGAPDTEHRCCGLPHRAPEIRSSQGGSRTHRHESGGGHHAGHVTPACRGPPRHRCTRRRSRANATPCQRRHGRDLVCGRRTPRALGESFFPRGGGVHEPPTIRRSIGENWTENGWRIASVNEMSQPPGCGRIFTLGLLALVAKPEAHVLVIYERPARTDTPATTGPAVVRSLSGANLERRG